MPVDSQVQARLARLLTELAKRAKEARRLEPYYDTCERHAPIPQAVVRARMTTAYRTLMTMSDAPWGSLVVDSVQDRLEVAGLRSTDKTAADRLWQVWQDNALDAESKLAHNSALLNGRAFAVVWPDEAGQPEIALDPADQMIVEYAEGSRRRRVGALRHWTDRDDRQHATLYTPVALYKFSEALEKNAGGDRFQAADTWWEPREVDGEDWPLPNPYGVLPVVEIAVNRRLKAGEFPYARGEFAHCTGLIDRINLLTFLGLIVALWLGFPLRGVIGDRILRDDDGKPIPPFDAEADKLFQLENPQAQLAEFKAADRKNLSIFAELDQLAVITKTPRHYFPLEQGMSNISADAIRASEGGLHAKVTGHKASLGESWETVLRIAGRMLPERIDLPPGAELLWKDHESRSMAERADAATKLKDMLPWQAIAERVLNATQEEIGRWEEQRASDGLNALIAAAAQPAPAPVAEPVPGG